MFQISAEEGLALYRQSAQASDYPDKADNRVRAGIIFPQVRPRFQIPRGGRVFTIGSCFARNIEEKLPGFTLPTTRFAVPKAEWGGRPNGLLNEYSPGTMCQRISAALSGSGSGESGIVRFGDGVADLLLPGGHAVSMERALARRTEIDEVYRSLRDSDALIITLGLVQSWYDTQDQLYLNRMPSPWAMKHSPGRYGIRILDVDTSYHLLDTAVDQLVSAGIEKILMTVSPVPMQKAFNGVDATIANVYSKSVLRVCVDKLYSKYRQVDYLPSYEIVLSGGADMFVDDNRTVRDDVVEQIAQFMIDLYVR